MKCSSAFLALIALGPVANCAQLGPAFSSLYSITDLGSVSGVPVPYSSLVFQSGKPNVLLLGGGSTKSTGEIYSVPLARNATTNHVTSLGSPAPFASAPNIDGGLIYAPNGDLFFTEYNLNQIGEIKPGHASPDKTVPAPVSPSTGSLQIVPAGFAAAGRLVIDSIDTSQFCSTTLTADTSGTYDIGNCSATVSGSNKTEGIIYVPAGMPGFSGPTMLVAEFAGQAVMAYSVDSNGLPIISTGQVFISGLSGPQGAAIDPLTGDFFFSTFSFGEANEVFKVSLTSPEPMPTITSVTNSVSLGTQLCPGLTATVNGTNFGANAADVLVTIGGLNAPILNATVTSKQFSIQIPFELSPGPTTLAVTVSGAPSLPFPIALAATAPAFLTQGGVSAGLAAAYPAAGSNQNTPVGFNTPARPGDALRASAVGLGSTTPATPTGKAPATAATASTPTLTVGGVNATVTSASIPAGSQGVYQVAFTVPPGVQGTVPLVIAIGGQSSASDVTLALAGTSAVVNNASFANPGAIAPGSIASLFANGLGNATTNELSLFPSTQSEGVQVTFNGEAATLFHLLPGASPQQIDLLVPADLPTSGTVNVQLMTSSATYANYKLTMVPASPGFYRFTDPQTSTQFAIAQFVNSAWLALPASTTSSLGLPGCTASTSALSQCGEPAAVGDYLTLYLTGLGLATPNGDPSGMPLPAGQNPPADGSVLYETPTQPAVTIGGIPAKILFSGLAPGYAGEYQIDVQVPAGVTNGDNVPIVVTMLGASDTAAISVQSARVPPPGQ
ncbi:MAG TPA: IPT/TIG domain-containing protein [Bryobacteraceae bacterium]|nr:IPT/TIG domain-containing protein [Bryobacteraceae bacterium]